MITILGYQISPSIVISEEKKQSFINTINPHCYCVAKKDTFYKNVLQNSDILIPDGIGMVWAARILSGVKIKRITGADLHIYLLQKMNKENGKIFYLGSATSTLKLLEKKVKQNYPSIKISSYSPPFKSEFSKEDNAFIVSTINEFKPDVVFVGLTAPKQEKWAFQHKSQLETKIIASIGAVFDFYAGTVKRPGPFWQKIGLEWLLRLLREPKRLWKRNFISTPCFLWDVFKTKLGLTKQLWIGNP